MRKRRLDLILKILEKLHRSILEENLKKEECECERKIYDCTSVQVCTKPILCLPVNKEIAYDRSERPNLSQDIL